MDPIYVKKGKEHVSPVNCSLLTRLGIVLACLISISTLIYSHCLGEEESGKTSAHKVRLWSKEIILSRSTTQEFLEALEKTERESIHGIIHMKKNPTIEEKDRLVKMGLIILTPIHNTFYNVNVSKRFDIDDDFVRSLVQDMYLPKAQDKVLPDLWLERYERFIVNTPEKEELNYVLNPDGSLNLTVQFYKDVSQKEIQELLERYTLRFNKLADFYWEIMIKKENVRGLAGEDPVRTIDAGLAPFLPDLDTTRRMIKVEDVHNFNIATGLVQGVGGSGTQIGIFEGRGFDETHDDFGTRVIVNDGIRGMHGTHVAGIAAASGASSNQNDSWGQNNGGTPFQWRGTAPEAELIDSPSANATDAADMLNYISTNGMDVSNHSYSFSFDGHYGNDNSIRDETIRGDLTSNGVQVPGRLQVYSAGNHGRFPGNGGEQIGYFSLTKQVKNALIVGNYDVGNNRINEGSSLGPSHDGRIKPDVVAPGTDVISTAHCDAMDNLRGTCGVGCIDPTTGAVAVRQDFYHTCTGTSMSAPAVTGTAALILEQYATTYNRNIDTNPPLPSTLRAIIIHTADDIAAPEWFENEDAPVVTFPGPDYVTGFGMLDAEEAVDIVSRRLIIEGTINNTCDRRTYRFIIGTNRTEPIKVTLAWDDIPGNTLLNDLDLELIDPNGSRHYPYLLDQTVFDLAGNLIPDNQQNCGTQVVVQRNILPTPNPNFLAPNHPNNVNDPIQPDDLRPAGFGKDHINNVEMVVAQPTPGIWRAMVTGFNVVQGPQRFSLIGIYPFLFDPPIWCKIFPFLCDDFIYPCKKYPFLCEPYIVLPGKLGPIIEFRHELDKIVIPLDKICLYVLDCPGCHDVGLCPGYDLMFTEMPDNFGLEIFDSKGTSIIREINGKRSKRLKLRTREDETYFIVISPGSKTVIGKKYEIPMKVGTLPE